VISFRIITKLKRPKIFRGAEWKKASLASFVGFMITTVLPSLSRKLALYILPVSASAETLG
jgi:hypothetical protein